MSDDRVMFICIRAAVFLCILVHEGRKYLIFVCAVDDVNCLVIK